MSFDRWKKRLAREQVVAFVNPDEHDEGYYRKPLYVPRLGPDGKTNGQKQIVGYEPVAFFLDEGEMIGVIGVGEGRRNIGPKEEVWSWCVRNPISYEWYTAVAENGEPWPDQAQWAPSVRTLSENQGAPPEQLLDDAPEGLPAQPEAPPVPVEEPHIKAKRLIIEAIAEAPSTVTTPEEAAKAAGAKNLIAERRLEATRQGEALYKPPYAEYKRLHGIWSPMVAVAETAEKTINRMVLAFNEGERKRIAAEAAERDRIAAEIVEINERVAQRAIANGLPESPPKAVEEAAPPPPPAPAAVQPTYGTRKIKAELKKFAVIGDPVAAFKHFQNDTELMARLQKLADETIRSGHDVPGTTVREGYL